MNELERKRIEKQYAAYYGKYWEALALQQTKKAAQGGKAK